MRLLVATLLATGLLAGPAAATTIRFATEPCGCDPSSGDEDAIRLIVRAGPDERNEIAVRRRSRGTLVEDHGAALTGCRASRRGGRFCPGEFDGVVVRLGDGDDRLEVSGQSGGTIDDGPGDDTVIVDSGVFVFESGAGSDRLEAISHASATVSYADRGERVAVRLNGLPDDGAEGEGDDVRGSVSRVDGGGGDDLLEAGSQGVTLSGGAGDDRLVGGLGPDIAWGGEGDDAVEAGAGDDRIEGGPGADAMGGGPGSDLVTYWMATGPVRVTLGDGPGDGAARENDHVQGDVENLEGSQGDDLLVGDGGPNELDGDMGADALYGGAGADRLIGDRVAGPDLLDPGAGPDRVLAFRRDSVAVDDGEPDRVRCYRAAPAIEWDPLDSFRSCAPFVQARSRGGAGRRVRLTLVCDRLARVPCEGRVVLRHSRRPVSRAVRFGPIPPGGRQLVAARLTRLPSWRFFCPVARAVTERAAPDSSTVSWLHLTCLRPRSR
ncbi:MAG TPA: calcium-binding protein [Thermoleophilaceae bacterium]|nr:calcium-binding protein [Thermoleophilaceae bacterium]